MDQHNEYETYPKGYNRLTRKLLPVFLWPFRNRLMALFLAILREG